jgi:hypothetical protein
MGINLNRFANGDIAYIGKHNANCDALESAVNSLQLQITGSAGSALSSGTGFEALYGAQVAVIGIDSYLCTGAGTSLTVAPGYAWLASQQLAVKKPISFSGVASGTYYIVLSTTGEPSRSPSSSNAVYQVAWNGAAFTSITRVAALAWGYDDFLRAMTSGVLGATYERLDERLEASEQAVTAMLIKSLAAADVTLTTKEGMEHIAIRLTGALTANRNLIMPARAKAWIVDNNCSGNFTVTVKTPGGAGVATSSGSTSLLYCDGTNIERVALTGTGDPGSFLGLTDTPDVYTGAANKVIKVKPDESGLEFTTAAAPSSFTGLTDVPQSYSGQAAKLVQVKADETGLEFGNLAPSTLLGLSDTPDSYTGQADKRVTVKADESGVEFKPDDFLNLADTPDAYAGKGLKLVSVKSDESGLEFSDNATPAAFVGLLDAPHSYAGKTQQFVRVRTDETGLEFVETTGAQSFLELADTPVNYSGQEGRVVQVKPDATGLEFGAQAPSSYLGLTDTPDSFAGKALLMATVKADESGLEFSPNATPTAFIGLIDAPASYTGQAGKDVRVKSDGAGLEFYSPPYDVGAMVKGKAEASATVLHYVFPRPVTFPAGLTGSQGRAGTAATAQADFTIQKNGAGIGTLRFAAGATTAIFLLAAATAFAAGDVLKVLAPATPDAMLADITFSLAGTR